ncbi:hypothetical protein FGIG_01163 [Fasciola gigantica]|uniref:Uncharacterized protein n=1 Tax=Fasciola gigantica TaxID=46835 RepID=A0A504Z234_FASGI|nr:hypothetical protein FGIG_01163 [Fasciola gigantica]
MSVAPTDETQMFMIGFITLNKITAESRTLYQSVGTENDSPELRERLILLQRLLFKEIYITRIHLMECWRIESNNTQDSTKTNSAERLYAGFVATVDYHMRSLLNTMDLLNLFPTADTTLSFVETIIPRTRDARSLSWTAKSAIRHLITTGLTQLPDLQTVLQATEEIEMTNMDQDSERNLLKSEYLALQKVLDEVSSFMSIAPWTVFACPTELMKRLSGTESDGDNITIPSNFRFRFSDSTNGTLLTLPTTDRGSETAKKFSSSVPSISENQIEVIESGVSEKPKPEKKQQELLLFLKNRRSLTIVMGGLLTLVVFTVVLCIYAFTDHRGDFGETKEVSTTNGSNIERILSLTPRRSLSN